MFRKGGLLVKGKDLKGLLHLNKGVLVYKGNKLTFVAYEDPIRLVLSNLNEKAKEPITFISEEFDKVNALNDNEDYIIDFKDNIMEVWDKNREHIVLAIIGISV